MAAAAAGEGGATPSIGSADGSEEDWRPYSERPEWQDVQPVGTDDPGDVVAIQYTAEHAEALAYLRAARARNERSLRVLHLTADVIGHNQADYTAWHWRWLCVQALGETWGLQREHRFTQAVMVDNAKNYQLWNHRRKMALAGGPSCAHRELDFATAALDLDAKNYHAWAHRQAVVRTYGHGQLEHAYAEAKIEQDVRNNSAWNQRAFLLRLSLQRMAQMHRRVDIAKTDGSAPQAEQGAAEACPPSTSGAAAAGTSAAATIPPAAPDRPAEGMHTTTGAGAAATPATAAGNAAQHAAGESALQTALQFVIADELRFVARQLLKAPRNESPWAYCRGLFTLPGTRPHELAYWPEIYTLCLEVLMESRACTPAADLLAEYYLELGLLAAERACVARVAIEHAEAACTMLRAAATDPAGIAGASGMAGFGAGVAEMEAEAPPIAALAAEAVGSGLPGHAASLEGLGAESLGMQQQESVVSSDEGLNVSAGGTPGSGHADELDQHIQLFFAGQGEAAKAARLSSQQSVQAAGIAGRNLLQQLLVADPMRGLYWQHRVGELRVLFDTMNAEQGTEQQVP